MLECENLKEIKEEANFLLINGTVLYYDGGKRKVMKPTGVFSFIRLKEGIKSFWNHDSASRF